MILDLYYSLVLAWNFQGLLWIGFWDKDRSGAEFGVRLYVTHTQRAAVLNFKNDRSIKS